MPTSYGESHSKGIYKLWIIKSPKGHDYARCKFCIKDISIGSMGASGLKSHNKGLKHKQLVAAASSTPSVRLVAPTAAASEPVTTNTSEANDVQVSSNVTTARTSSIKSYMGSSDHKDNVMKAEILWTIDTVVKNNSFHSNSEMGALMKKMFPDSKIVQDFKCAETKTKYILENGIQVCYLDLLLNSVANNAVSNRFVVLFDETLNNNLQQNQLDMYIRIWNIDTVLTRYIHSEFLGSAKAVDIVSCFESLDVIQPLTNMLQVSMDGPNVNLCAHGKLEERSQSKYGHGLLNMGSCGLHQVHNGLKAAMSPKDTEDGFKIHLFLSALYRMFHECPSRREQYTTETGSDNYPQSFATHRWADNGRATKRGVEMLPHLIKFCNAIDMKKKGITKPTSQCYKTVCEFIKDKFALVKLEFFISMCGEIEPFLVRFQTDKPMAPFLIKELNAIMISVARSFMKNVYCTDLKDKPMDLKIRTSSNYLSIRNISLGYAANKVIDEQLASEQVTFEEYEAMKIEFRNACIRFLDKLLDRSPAKHKLALSISCLDPKLIATHPSTAVSKFKKTLTCVADAKLIEANDFDKISRQFQSFADAYKSNSEFKAFNYTLEGHRVDTILHKALYGKHEYQYVWTVISQLLLLSHGQATVERGFSINKNASIVNQSEDSLVARRIVRDHVNYIGGISNVEVTPGLLQECKRANRRYNDRLKENREKKADTEKTTQKDELKKEIDAKKQQIKLNEDLTKYWKDEMQKTLNLAHDPDRTIIMNPLLLLGQIRQNNDNVHMKERELVTLKDELEKLRSKFQNI